MRAALKEIRVRIQARGRKQGAPGPRVSDIYLTCSPLTLDPGSPSTQLINNGDVFLIVWRLTVLPGFSCVVRFLPE